MMKTTPPDLSPDQLLDLHDAAAEWYVRREQPGWTAADERALDDWLAAAPLHRRTFEGMGQTWLDATRLRRLYPQTYGQPGARTPTTPTPAPAPASTKPTHRPGHAKPAWRRGPAFAGAAITALVLLAAGGWYRWDNTPGYVLEAATAAGDTRSIDLPDGTQIALNIASALQVRYYPRRREVVLNQGEAFFRVAQDASKPFTVDSGPSQVKVVGTAFNLRAAPPHLIVKVLEGRVEVRPDRAAAGGQVFLLGPESGIAIDPVTGDHHSVAARAAAVGDWRSGQIQFSRAPLAEVAAEVARYLGKPVTLDGARLAALPVSGFLSTDAPERFLQALPELVAVRVQPDADGGWRITARR